jgi:hypothetical protein
MTRFAFALVWASVALVAISIAVLVYNFDHRRPAHVAGTSLASVDLGGFVATVAATLAGVDPDVAVELFVAPEGDADFKAMLKALQPETEGPWGPTSEMPFVVTPRLRLEADLVLILQRLEARILALEAAKLLGHELDVEPLTGPDVLQILHHQAERIAELEVAHAHPIPQCEKDRHWSTYPHWICTTEPPLDLDLSVP